MEVYDPGTLSPGTTYYWSIETVVGIIPYEGLVWTFTTGGI